MFPHIFPLEGFDKLQLPVQEHLAAERRVYVPHLSSPSEPSAVSQRDTTYQIAGFQCVHSDPIEFTPESQFAAFAHFSPTIHCNNQNPARNTFSWLYIRHDHLWGKMKWNVFFCFMTISLVFKHFHLSPWQIDFSLYKRETCVCVIFSNEGDQELLITVKHC